MIRIFTVIISLSEDRYPPIHSPFMFHINCKKKKKYDFWKWRQRGRKKKWVKKKPQDEQRKKSARLTSEGRREQKEATEQHYIQHL